AAGQTINHLRASHFLRTAPGIEITVALQGEAMLFDAHVTHPHAIDQFVDRESAAAFERIYNFEPLRPADLCQQSLIHGLWAATSLLIMSPSMQLNSRKNA